MPAVAHREEVSTLDIVIAYVPMPYSLFYAFTTTLNEMLHLLFFKNLLFLVAVVLGNTSAVKQFKFSVPTFKIISAKSAVSKITYFIFSRPKTVISCFVRQNLEIFLIILSHIFRCLL